MATAAGQVGGVKEKLDLQRGTVPTIAISCPSHSNPPTSITRRLSNAQATDFKSDIIIEPSSNGLDHAGNDNPSGELAAAVRFKSEIEEISPEQTVSSEAPASQQYAGLQNPGEVTPALLRELSRSLHGSHLQELRMNTFSFEPFSLPPSRVCYPDHHRSPASFCVIPCLFTGAAFASDGSFHLCTLPNMLDANAFFLAAPRRDQFPSCSCADLSILDTVS